MIPGTEIGLKLIKYYCKMPLTLVMLELEAFNLKSKTGNSRSICRSQLAQTDYKNMDDCSCNRRHVLDSGSAELETGLAMLCTWNDLADQAKHSWVLTAIRQQEVVLEC
jgi:hypothetical protein